MTTQQAVLESQIAEIDRLTRELVGKVNVIGSSVKILVERDTIAAAKVRERDHVDPHFGRV